MQNHNNQKWTLYWHILVNGYKRASNYKHFCIHACSFVMVCLLAEVLPNTRVCSLAVVQEINFQTHASFTCIFLSLYPLLPGIHRPAQWLIKSVLLQREAFTSQILLMTHLSLYLMIMICLPLRFLSFMSLMMTPWSWKAALWWVNLTLVLPGKKILCQFSNYLCNLTSKKALTRNEVIPRLPHCLEKVTWPCIIFENHHARVEFLLSVICYNHLRLSLLHEVICSSYVVKLIVKRFLLIP